MEVKGGCEFLLTLFFTIQCSFGVRYDPTWPSIDSRPLPAWYDEAKLGIFIHWGVFSVPSFGLESAWMWEYWQDRKIPSIVQFMKDNYKPDFTYADFAKDFTAEFFNASQWADLFSVSGAKYITFVSKHHEGFCNWNTNVSFNWNSMAVGPKRDFVAELAEALRSRTDLHLGLYHSLFEFFNPLYLQDKENNFTTNRFVKQKTMPELYELVNTFKPDLIWSDGIEGIPSDYWKSKDFVAWLYNDSPVKDTVVTNDRWGSDTKCKHGGFLTCSDRYNPGVVQSRKWEGGLTIDQVSWGFRRNATLADYLTIEEIIARFVEIVSCGGNMALNVGPTKDGMISPIYEERLRQLGQWLKVNGEAIYSSKPWTFQNDTATPGVWYTMKDVNVYAMLLNWPAGDSLQLSRPTASTGTTVSLLGYPATFSWQNRTSGGIVITIPYIPLNSMPCMWAWVLKLTGITN